MERLPNNVIKLHNSAQTTIFHSSKEIKLESIALLVSML